MSDYTVEPIDPNFFDKRTKSSKYPWNTIAIGQAFKVPTSEISYGGMVSMAHKAGIRLGRKFKVVLEGDFFKVGRGYDPVTRVMPIIKTPIDDIERPSYYPYASQKIKDAMEAANRRNSADWGQPFQSSEEGE